MPQWGSIHAIHKLAYWHHNHNIMHLNWQHWCITFFWILFSIKTNRAMISDGVKFWSTTQQPTYNAWPSWQTQNQKTCFDYLVSGRINKWLSSFRFFSKPGFKWTKKRFNQFGPSPKGSLCQSQKNKIRYMNISTSCWK